MKVSHLDITSSLKAHFAVIGENARTVDCDNFKDAEGTVNRIQEALDLIKERIAVGKRIGKGDKLEPVVIFQPEGVKSVSG